MSFLSVCPRSKKYLTYTVSAISLKVVQNNGVEVNPDVNITVNELNNGYKQFVNNSGDSDTFKVNVIIKHDECITGEIHERIKYDAYEIDSNSVINMTGVDLSELEYLDMEKDAEDSLFEDYQDFPVITVLDYWIKNAEPLYVITEAIGVPNGYYIIKENGSRKQSYRDYTVWTLEFMKYKQLKLSTFKSTTKGITKAIKKLNSKKTKATAKAKAKTKQATGYKTQLKKCNYKVLKYSKKKKTVKCVKIMQQLLYHYGCLDKKSYIDGWYGKVTVEAVKKFQKKYKAKYKLKVNGKVGKSTWKALYTGGSTAVQIGKTRVIK